MFSRETGSPNGCIVSFSWKRNERADALLDQKACRTELLYLSNGLHLARRLRTSLLKFFSNGPTRLDLDLCSPDILYSIVRVVFSYGGGEGNGGNSLVGLT
jgi:hypothetical protein